MQHYHDVASRTGKLITKRYSTSFSLGTRLLSKDLRAAIYSIYGFVRLADEIVDTFHDHDKATLLAQFRADTWAAIEQRISLNPVLQAFQRVVNQYEIEHSYIAAFFDSMEMDLNKSVYNKSGYQEYIYGSAEVVGLMCLQVFCRGDHEQFNRLKGPARKLGAAFQKVNFLRDLNEDYQELGRTYFPNLDLTSFTPSAKAQIEAEIEADFKAAWEGIKALPKGSKLGVYVAYVYYLNLFKRIRNKPGEVLFEQRVRVPNYYKLYLMASSYMKYRFRFV